jgi:type II secretory ATPase GspE/PulE/Tfp pilus assembly ATPase PilB-like protein
MGVSGDDLADASNLFIAQRLVRRLCPECAEKTEPTAEEKATIEKVLATIAPTAGVTTPEITIHREKGCPACKGTGYNGQMILSEALSVDQDIKDLIVARAQAHEIENKAVEKGMLTMLHDGILAVLEGRTTLEEIKRVTEI